MGATTQLGRNIETVFRLTPIQEGILYHSRMPEAPGTYVQQYTCTLEGKTDEERFRAAWKTVIRRRPAMRRLVAWEGREIRCQCSLLIDSL